MRNTSLENARAGGYSATTVNALRLLIEHPDWLLCTLRNHRDSCDGPIWSAEIQNPHASEPSRIRVMRVPTPVFRVMLREHLLAETGSHANGSGSDYLVVTFYRPSYAGEILGRRKEATS